MFYAIAEEHRELVRQQLQLLLKAGYSPLRFYVHDIKKYFYLGELLALVDLSLVILCCLTDGIRAPDHVGV
jgi:hypothetical protein